MPLHVIQLVSEGLTSVTLTSGFFQCGSYRMESPGIRATQVSNSQEDGGEVGTVTYDNVTEDLDLLIQDDRGSGWLQTHYNLLVQMTERARLRHKHGRRVEPVYIQAQWAGETSVWRSEILYGEPTLIDGSLDQMHRLKMECRLFITRRYYWEPVTEIEVPLQTRVNGGPETGGVEIHNNHGTSLHGNYVQIASTAVTGTLPAACRIEFTNTTGTSIAYRNVYIGQNVYSGPTGFNHIYEGENNTASGGTDTGADSGTHTGANNASELVDSSKSWTTNEHVGQTIYNITDGSSGAIQANTATTVTAILTGGGQNDWDTGEEYIIGSALFSGGLYTARTWTGAITHSTSLYQWNITGTQLGYAAGGYFRVLARVVTTPNTSTFVKVSVYHNDSKLVEAPEVQLDFDLQLQDLGKIQLPPSSGGVFSYGALQLRITARDSVSGSLNIDFIQLTPLDGYRVLQPLGGTYVNGTKIIEDSMAGHKYINEGAGGIYTEMATRGKPIHLSPNRTQRLYFLFDEATNTNINRTSNVRIYYRPRRLTI